MLKRYTKIYRSLREEVEQLYSAGHKEEAIVSSQKLDKLLNDQLKTSSRKLRGKRKVNS